VVGADADYVAVEGVVDAALLKVFPSAGVKDFSGEIEFLTEFECPLFTQGGWADNDQTALAFSPQLAKHQGCFDCLAQADFVGKDDAPAGGVVERKQCGVDLMWVEVTLASKRDWAIRSSSPAARRRVSSQA
jgi:hypothetical protein